MKALAVFLVLGMATPAWAGVSYSGGKVVSDGNAAYSIGAEDAALAGVGVGILAHSLTWVTAGSLIAPASFIVWGAIRTDAHRPQEVKDRISAAIEARKSAPIPGSVSEVLK